MARGKYARWFLGDDHPQMEKTDPAAEPAQTRLKLRAVVAATLIAAASLVSSETAPAETIRVEHGTLEIFEGDPSRLGGYGENITFQFAGDCSLPAKIEIGPSVMYRIASICGEDKWQGWDHMKPIWLWEQSYQPKGDFGSGRKGLPLTISADTDPLNFERTYPVRVHFGGRLIRRFLYIYLGSWPPKRIYEGTDAFVNVCINRGLEIRSSGGVLYCETPGSTTREVQISKRR